MPEDDGFGPDTDRSDPAGRVHINGSTVGRRPDAEPGSRPGADGDRAAGYTDIPEWVSEFRRLYVEPKTRPDRRDRLGWPRRPGGSSRPDAVAGGGGAPRPAEMPEAPDPVPPLPAPGPWDVPAGDGADTARPVVDVAPVPLFDRPRRAEEIPAGPPDRVDAAGLGWPDAVPSEVPSGTAHDDPAPVGAARTGSGVGSAPGLDGPPAIPAADDAPGTGDSGVDDTRALDDWPTAAPGPLLASADDDPTSDRPGSPDETAVADPTWGGMASTDAAAETADTAAVADSTSGGMASTEAPADPAATDVPTRRSARHRGSSGARRPPTSSREVDGAAGAAGGSDDDTGRGTRAGARRAARLAERRARQRRLLALAAAVLLVIVVATTWWVTRGTTSASAGPLDARPSTFALAGPAAPAALRAAGS